MPLKTLRTLNAMGGGARARAGARAHPGISTSEVEQTGGRAAAGHEGDIV